MILLDTQGKHKFADTFNVMMSQIFFQGKPFHCIPFKYPDIFIS